MSNDQQKDLNLKFIDLKGKQYLPVPERIRWFRSINPLWTIKTALKMGPSQCLAKAEVLDESGRLVAMAHKQETVKDFNDYIEKAETGAIGRALAILGFGTAGALELDETPRIVDSPMETKNKLPNMAPTAEQLSKNNSSNKSDGFIKSNAKNITDAQARRLYAIAKERGFSREQISKFCQLNYSVIPEAIHWDKYDRIIEEIKISSPESLPVYQQIANEAAAQKNNVPFEGPIPEEPQFNFNEELPF